MKKQLLFIVLVFFTSVLAFAQPLPHDPPTCNGDAASPAVGILYTYEVDIPADGGYTGAGTFDWYVMTQGQLNLLTGTHIGPATNAEFVASGHYDTPTASANTIDITWTSAALATGEPYFLVVVYEEATVCATNNIKVYRIEPQNTFWLAIDNISTVQCAASVLSAIITDEDAPEVEYIYGENTITFSITAGGYTGSWDAELQLAGFADDQVLTVEWAAAIAGTSGTFTDPGSGHNGIWEAVLPSSTTVSGGVTTNELITVTITVANNHFENLLGQTIDIAIDGSYTSGSTVFPDLSDVNGLCTPESAFADAVQQTIDARPTITPVNPGTFVPQVTP